MKQTIKSQKRKPSWLHSFSHGVVFLLIVFCSLLLLNQKGLENYVIPQYQGTHGHTESTWTLKKGDEVIDPAVRLPSFMHLQTGERYSISAPLTYDGRTDPVPFAFFYIHHMYCRAYLNGQAVFSYMPEDIHKLDRSRSPGNVYVSFPMPEDCLGQEFKLEFIPPLSAEVEYELPYPVFGDYPTEAFHTFKNDLPHNIIALLSAFLGIGSIIFATLALSGSEYREGLYIGIFALLFCIYNITECNFNFYVISNPYYTYILNYITFTLIPVFLFAFLRERMDPRQKPVVSGLLITGSTLFFAELLLHFTGTLDMREFLPILHISDFAGLIIIFILISAMKQKRRKKQLLLQMIPILIGMILDAAVYYEHWTISRSDAAFSTIGTVIFLIIELYHVWCHSIEIYTESIRSQEYHQMAYVDSLTGIGNRRAYETERLKILSGETRCHGLYIASVDVNFLKNTNDTMGHAAGDFLIRSAANVLSRLSENHGTAFRVGGDEFIVLLFDLEENEFQEMSSRLEAEIRAVNSNSEVKLSLAVGWERSNGRDLDEALKKADMIMYANKAKIKGSGLKTKNNPI